MEPLLQKLYEGEFHPAQDHAALLTDYAVLQQYTAFSEKLRAIDPLLCEEWMALFDQHLDALEQEFSDIYADGFRTGARMMLEILKEQT